MKQNTHFTDENQRKIFAKVSSSNNNYSFKIIDHSTTRLTLLTWVRGLSSLSGEAGSQPRVGKGSETGPMMGDLRVALRTLSVKCRLFRESDPRPYWHQAYRRFCGQHYTWAGRRPGAQKSVPPGQVRAGGAGGEADGVSVKVLVLFQKKVLQRAEQIIEDKVVDRVQQRFENQDLEAPRLSRAVWRGSSGAVLRREHVARAVSLGNLDITSTSFSSGKHMPSCLRQSADAFGRISSVFPREGVLGSSGRFAVALENLDCQRALCI